MLDHINVHHHVANLAVISVPMVSIMLRADTWAVISGMLAAVYYGIIIGKEVARWIKHWQDRNKPKV